MRALFFNCSLKPGSETSNTQGLADIALNILERNGVETETIRAVEHDIAPGIYPDMREHGFDTDAWPDLFEKVKASNIVIIGTPIWLGQHSSVCKRVIERLYGNSSMTNDRGQYVFYGKVGGCIVTGNEDGAKHCGMDILYSLQHVGFTIPPGADASWVGDSGPGPSYLDDDSGAADNDFTNRTVTFMAWNMLHLARMLEQQGGIPAEGNIPKAWKDGERWGFEEAQRKALGT